MRNWPCGPGSWERMQRKIEMICLFREESDGGVVKFSKVSVKIRTFDSIFFRTKVSMFFSTHTVSKKQKSMAFLRMPIFLGCCVFF